MTREGSGRKDHCKTLVRVWDIGHYAINHSVSASHERLLHLADARVVEDPHAVMVVRGDDVDCVHGITVNQQAQCDYAPNNNNGTKYSDARSMSAIPPKADMRRRKTNVR
jgi:hypothetical protein